MRKFLHEFRHYPDGTIEDNRWWEIIGDKVYNMAGGWHDYRPSEDDIIVVANDWNELDWSCLLKDTTTYGLKDNSLYGWIDVHGKFYGCDYMEHDRIAYLYFKCTERNLEDAGFAKVYRDYDGSRAYYVAKYLTERQEKTLIDMGIEL